MYLNCFLHELFEINLIIPENKYLKMLPLSRKLRDELLARMEKWNKLYIFLIL
jgi:hypothetical protein